MTLRALLFDVDGTLYDQRPVRRAMLGRLIRHCLSSPSEGLSAMRVLREFRRAQETLRHEGTTGDLELAQIRVAADAANCPEDRVRMHVGRWMEREPLDLVAAARFDGLTEVLATARRRGLRLGVCSDYPAAAKLQALGVAHLFDTVVCAQDADVQRFKPDPRSLLVALGRLGVSPAEAIYVGDRPDVDGVAARRAGMDCVIVSRSSLPASKSPGPSLRYTCRALAEALEQEAI
jgi:HAD superfamily hydrolase (TIGR01509 family)